jgi:hypothetical protein
MLCTSYVYKIKRTITLCFLQQNQKLTGHLFMHEKIYLWQFINFINFIKQSTRTIRLLSK